MPCDLTSMTARFPGETVHGRDLGAGNSQVKLSEGKWSALDSGHVTNRRTICDRSPGCRFQSLLDDIHVLEGLKRRGETHTHHIPSEGLGEVLAVRGHDPQSDSTCLRILLDIRLGKSE